MASEILLRPTNNEVRTECRVVHHSDFVIPSSFNASPARTIQASDCCFPSGAPLCRTVYRDEIADRIASAHRRLTRVPVESDAYASEQVALIQAGQSASPVRSSTSARDRRGNLRNR